MNLLENKVAIVTGGASGIGKSIAELYVANGAKVVVSDTNDDLGQRVAAALGQNALYVHADVSQPEHCQRLVRTAVERWGALHIACNNAGISGEMAATADLSLEGWNRIIAVNLSGVFYCMKYQIPEMLRSGGGSIVNISSILGQVAFAGAPAYTASKHGLLGLTRAAALEYGTAGIRVNVVGPAFIRTPMISVLDDNMLNTQIAPLHAVGRLGEPHEVAELVVWLSSDRASFATGAYYPIDGGYLAR